jgi:hypothetical protein
MNDIDTREIGTGKKTKKERKMERILLERRKKTDTGEEKDEDDKEVEEKDVDEE